MASTSAAVRVVVASGLIAYPAVATAGTCVDRHGVEIQVEARGTDLVRLTQGTIVIDALRERFLEGIEALDLGLADYDRGEEIPGRLVPLRDLGRRRGPRFFGRIGVGYDSQADRLAAALYLGAWGRRYRDLSVSLRVLGPDEVRGFRDCLAAAIDGAAPLGSTSPRGD